MNSDLNQAATKYFGNTAKNYDEIRRKKNMTSADDLIINNFISKCEPGSVFLDLPAGTGRAVAMALENKLTYIGVDISKDMLTICNEKIANYPGAKATTFVADAKSTGLANESVDYLISVKFIKWLETDDQILSVLSEFKRICRNQCLLNVKITHGSSLRDWLSKFARFFSAAPQSRAINEQKFMNLCKQAGWKVVQVQENPASRGTVKFYTLQ